LKDGNDKTALDWAKEFNHKEIENLLINHDRKEKLKNIITKME
jgi:ankyrin repeat protein